MALLFLASCQSSDEKLTFSGGTENWQVVYEVAKEKPETTSKVKIKYIGDKPIPKQIAYRIDAPSGSAVDIGSLNKEGELTIQEDDCLGCQEMNEGTEINVAIEWGRQIEMFTLHFDEQSGNHK